MIRRFAKGLEIAKEDRIDVVVNGEGVEVVCTPENLVELAAGVAVTRFGLKDIVSVEVKGKTVYVEAGCKAESEAGSERVKKQELRSELSGITVKELQKMIGYLDVEEYRNTRGYHIAAAVKDGEVVARMHDVSRHSVLAKVIGSCTIRSIDVKNCYVLFSGRISRSIVEMCYTAEIPLIVSKAAIFDSAIDFCLKSGVNAVSFASGLIVGKRVTIE